MKTSGIARLRLHRSVRVALIVLTCCVLFMGTWVLLAVITLPGVEHLARQRPKTTAFMQDFLERYTDTPLLCEWVAYEDISPHLKRAVLVSEDINFFAHNGFDGHEIGQALSAAWRNREAPRGASTISQQLARNLFLSTARTPWRKLNEALLTWRLESNLDKRRILEIYLNVVEFGPGIYGAEAASRFYFDKDSDSLTQRQAAQLAAVLPRPKSWRPGGADPGYEDAVERILRRMEKADFLWKRI